MLLNQRQEAIWCGWVYHRCYAQLTQHILRRLNRKHYFARCRDRCFAQIM